MFGYHMLGFGVNVAAGSGGGGAGHRYWRVSVTANNGGNFAGAVEVEFLDGVGGTDQTGSGIASASSEAFGAAANAFDNNTGTSWLSNFPPSFPEWIKYDFGDGNDVEVPEFTITAGTPPTDQMKDFTLDWSDNDSDWTTAKTVTGETGWSNLEKRTYTV